MWCSVAEVLTRDVTGEVDSSLAIAEEWLRDMSVATAERETASTAWVEVEDEDWAPA